MKKKRKEKKRKEKKRKEKKRKEKKRKEKKRKEKKRKTLGVEKEGSRGDYVPPKNLILVIFGNI
jgi:hypothetical protein